MYEASFNLRFTSRKSVIISDDSAVTLNSMDLKLVYGNDTELSKYICTLKCKNTEHEISWEVIKRAQPTAVNNNPVCRLCLKEATVVVYALNKKTV